MKLSASQFADEVGVQRSSVSHVLSGRNKPSLDFVTKILTAYTEVNSEWLITGKGSMFLDDYTVHGSGDMVVDQQTSIDMDSGMTEPPQRSGPVQPVEKKKAGSKKLTAGHKNIEKIVLFYSDGTFIDFTPGDA